MNDAIHPRLQEVVVQLNIDYRNYRRRLSRARSAKKDPYVLAQMQEDMEHNAYMLWAELSAEVDHIVADLECGADCPTDDDLPIPVPCAREPHHGGIHKPVSDVDRTDDSEYQDALSLRRQVRDGTTQAMEALNRATETRKALQCSEATPLVGLPCTLKAGHTGDHKAPDEIVLVPDTPYSHHE